MAPMLAPNFLAAVGDADAPLFVTDLDMTTARENERLGVAASFLMVELEGFTPNSFPGTLNTAWGTGEAYFRQSQEDEAGVRLIPGTSYSIGPTNELWITNTAQAMKMLRLYFSNGPVIQPYASSVILGGSISLKGGVDIPTTADVAATTAAQTQVLASNSSRQEAILYNNSAFTLRVGDVNTGASRGVAFPPGEIRLATQGAIYVWNPGGADAQINVTEITV